MIPKIYRWAALPAFFVIFFANTAFLNAQLNAFALPHATLAAAIGAGDTALTVDQTAGFPPSGEIAIETEVLSYSAVNGTTFVISGRGQASTTAAAHAAGVAVIYFPVHAGLLTQSIDAASTTLNLNSTATFPPGSGSFIIDQEIIGYGGGTTTTLTPLTRGLEGSAPTAHNAGAVIIGRAAAPEVQTFEVPRMVSSLDNFSGFAVVNTSEGPANVTLQLFNSDGTPLTLTDNSGTTATASRLYTIQPGHQLAGTVADLIGNTGNSNGYYASVSTGNAKALGVVPIGNVDPNTGFNRLTLAPFSFEAHTDALLPVAIQGSAQYGGGVTMEIGVIESTVANTITADFVDATGNVVQSVSLTPSAGQRIAQNLAAMFTDLQGQTIESGYVHLYSASPFTAYELVYIGNEIAYFDGIDRVFAAPTEVLPFVIASGGYQTRIVLTDGTAAVSGQAPVGIVNAELTAYNADGSLLSGAGITNPAFINFPVSGQFSKFLTDVFGIPSGASFTGYVKVSASTSSSSTGVVTSAILLNLNRNQVSAEPGQILGEKQLTFSPAWFDPSLTTAMALVNSNNDPATAHVEIIRGDGSVQKSTSVTIPGLGQSILVLSSLFPDIVPESDGYFSVTSSLPLYGMTAFDDGRLLVSGYPVKLPDDFTVSPNPINLATPNSSSVPADASSYPLTIQIPNPAPPGGLTVDLQMTNNVIASVPSTTVVIPEGRTSATVQVNGLISGATLLGVSAPGFNSVSAVVTVQNTSDFTVSRNVTLSPQSVTLPSGGTIQFTAGYDTTNPPAVVWNVSGVANGNNAVGTISTNGFFAAPLLLPTDQPLIVTISVTNVNTTFFGASTNVIVLPPPAQ